MHTACYADVINCYGPWDEVCLGVEVNYEMALKPDSVRCLSVYTHFNILLLCTIIVCLKNIKPSFGVSFSYLLLNSLDCFFIFLENLISFFKK